MPTGVGVYWSRMTPEQRSAEMTRRREVARRKQKGKTRWTTRKRTDLDAKVIAKMYANGTSVSEIAREFKVSHSPIRRILDQEQKASNQPTTQNPFAGLEQPEKSDTRSAGLRAYIDALDEVVAALKTFLGY